MAASKGDAGSPRVTDPNPPGWEPGGSTQSHDGLPTDIDFEGQGLLCFTPVTNEYAAIGVNFSGGAQALVDDGSCPYNSFLFPPHSPITVIFENDDGAITVDFDTARSDVGVRYTANAPLSMTCFTGAGGTGAVVGTSVATVPNTTGSPTPPNELLRVQGAGILSCVIAGTANAFTLDDFFFDAGPPPPPPGPTGPGTCGGQFTSPGVSVTTFNGVTTFIGTPGPDVIGGTDHIDIVFGGGGDDLICTWFGADWIDAGPGNDIVFGGTQNDRIFGKEGADELHGEAGQDRLDGGHTPVPSSLPDTQPDICDGGPNADRFYLCETIIDPADLPKT